MAEALLAADPTDAALVASSPTTVDTRNQRFAQLLNVKLEQGYRVESQGDTEAVLFTPGRRHWFGLFAGGEGARMQHLCRRAGRGDHSKVSPSG